MHGGLQLGLVAVAPVGEEYRLDGPQRHQSGPCFHRAGSDLAEALSGIKSHETRNRRASGRTCLLALVRLYRFSLVHLSENRIYLLQQHRRTRMGNIRGFGGPLSSNWHNRTVHLQRQILKRMRDLGIVPVLPAFAGHVPRAFARLFPNANMTKIGSWNRFEDKYCW